MGQIVRLFQDGRSWVDLGFINLGGVAGELTVPRPGQIIVGLAAHHFRRGVPLVLHTCHPTSLA